MVNGFTPTPHDPMVTYTENQYKFIINPKDFKIIFAIKPVGAVAGDITAMMDEQE